MLFLQTVAKHLSSPGFLTEAAILLRSFVKENYRFFSRFASNNNSDYLHFPALFFCSRVSLSFESSPALHWCQIYRNKTDVQKYCSENWKKRERKSTQSHKNKYNCEVSQVNNGTSIKTAKLRRDFVSSSQLFCNLTHKKASFWWDYKKISLVGKGLEIVRLFKDAIENYMNYVWIWKNDLVSCHNAKFIRPAHMVEWTFERPHIHTYNTKVQLPFFTPFWTVFQLLTVSNFEKSIILHWPQ